MAYDNTVPRLKRWRVTLSLPGPRGKLRTRIIKAVYYRIESGVITFRNPSNGHDYPEPVAVFGYGAWISVDNMEAQS